MVAALGLVAVVAGLLAAGALAAAAWLRGQRRSAARRLVAGVTLGGLYAAGLLGVSVTSTERRLAIGEVKCFDDWCVTVRSAPHVAGHSDQRHLAIAVLSRARRVAQRPDNPAAFLVTDAGEEQIRVPGLDQRLAPGQEALLQVTLTVPTAARDPRLLVTEGGVPSQLVIGDENSPWHAHSTWPL